MFELISSILVALFIISITLLICMYLFDDYTLLHKFGFRKWSVVYSESLIFPYTLYYKGTRVELFETLEELEKWLDDNVEKYREQELKEKQYRKNIRKLNRKLRRKL